ncbi:hypothetical protein L1887_18076 [Cichorium endivia]|nr:hypothetical protein L1887_18076 [Cichorium endivia]
MEEDRQKVEDAESNPKKVKSVNITRVRKPSERIMKKTNFSKFTNVESDPIILDFDSDYSAQRLASPFPQNPKKTDPTEHKRKMTTEALELPKKRIINDDTTNKDVPPKVRRVPPRRSSITLEVPISKLALEKQAQKKTHLKPVPKKTTLKQNIPAPTAPQPQSDNILIRTSPKPLFDTLHSLRNPQKKYLCEIGLRDLLDITVDGIPSHIGFYAVSNFDCDNMVLKVSGGQFPVNRQVVHHLLGHSHISAHL